MDDHLADPKLNFAVGRAEIIELTPRFDRTLDLNSRIANSKPMDLYRSLYRSKDALGRQVDSSARSQLVCRSVIARNFASAMYALAKMLRSGLRRCRPT